MIIERYIQKIEEKISFMDTPTLGLMGGKAGLCLFYANLYKHFKKENYYDSLQEHLNCIMDGFSHEDLHFTFSDGISGIIWTFNYLEEKEIIESVEELGLTDLNEKFYLYMEKEFKNKNWDYLHGGLGTLLGFYGKDSFALKTCVLYLYDNCITENDGSIKWYSEIYGQKINLGLSHGMGSIIYFLLKGLDVLELQQKSHELLTGAVKMILKHEQNFEEKGYCFESFIGDNYKSRLAWCYGDLSTAYLLHKAGKALKDNNVITKAIEIAKTTTLRKKTEDTFLIDAGLCHGSSGLSLIYKKFYKETGLDIFYKASDFWLYQTIDILNNTNFMFYDRYDNTWKNNTSFLEGLSGVGLVLLYHISEEEPTWDRCLLLS